MAYADYTKGFYNINDSDTWKQIAVGTIAEQVELNLSGIPELPANSASTLMNWFTSVAAGLNTAGGLLKLDNSGKINIGNLPPTLLGGMQPKGNMTAIEGLDDLLDRVTNPLVNVGDYAQIATQMTINDTSTLYTHTMLAPGDAGDYDLSDGIILEPGDFIVLNSVGDRDDWAGVYSPGTTYVCTAIVEYANGYYYSIIDNNIANTPNTGGDNAFWVYQGTNASNRYEAIWAIVDNRHDAASTTVTGVVKLSDVAAVGDLGDLNDVITEDVLKDLIDGSSGGDGLLKDSEFASAGFMKTDGSGGYSVVNKTFLETAGGTMIGDLIVGSSSEIACAASHDLAFVYRDVSNATQYICMNAYLGELIVAGGLSAGKVLTTGNIDAETTYISDYDAQGEQLAQYSIGTVSSDVADQDTIKAALAKIEFRAKTAYDWGDHPDITTGTADPTGGKANDVYIQQVV